jgi:hypothetical protein
VDSTTKFLPFKVMYIFNYLTPMDLIYVLVGEKISLNSYRSENTIKVCDNRLKREKLCMKLKVIKSTNMLNSSQVIGLSTYAQ